MIEMNDVQTVVPQYKWANTIKDLDSRKCVFCGSEIYLQAHHIKQKSKFPELENVLENGITLCSWCHHAAHFYKNSPIHDFITDYQECRIILTLPYSELTAILNHIASTGESLNEFIRKAINETWERDLAGKENSDGPEI